jgi:hypothetical protein
MATASYPTVIKSSDQIVSNCRTQKKSFPTSAAAETFASEVQLRNPGQVRQHAYACEECPNWHLSAMTPGAHAMVESRSSGLLSEASKYASVPGLGRKYAHLQTKIKDVYQRLAQERGGQFHGIISQVTRAVGMPNDDGQVVRIFLTDAGLYRPNPRMVASQGRPAKFLPSIEGITAEEQELESRLRELHAKKQALIDAKAFKFGLGPDKTTVVIKKEAQTFALTIDDARELTEKLVDFLALI